MDWYQSCATCMFLTGGNGGRPGKTTCPHHVPGGHCHDPRSKEKLYLELGKADAPSPDDTLAELMPDGGAHDRLCDNCNADCVDRADGGGCKTGALHSTGGPAGVLFSFDAHGTSCDKASCEHRRDAALILERNCNQLQRTLGGISKWVTEHEKALGLADEECRAFTWEGRMTRVMEAANKLIIDGVQSDGDSASTETLHAVLNASEYAPPAGSVARRASEMILSYERALLAATTENERIRGSLGALLDGREPKPDPTPPEEKP